MSFDRISLDNAPYDYFEVSLLDIGPDAAGRMSTTLKRIDERGSHLDFDRINAEYSSDVRALTVYGVISPISTSDVAIRSLQRCAEKARCFDDSSEQLAS